MRNIRSALIALIAAPLLAAGPQTSVRAVRAAAPPVIDADLNDPVWQSAPEISGFTQHDPDDGKPATQKTVVRIAYDDQAIYVAARMEDTKKVTTLLGRRDNDLESDWFLICIDAQHDRLTGASFYVNPSNVQRDKALFNDIYQDLSWDAVWTSAAKIVPGGWQVEVRIPYSQLRFPDRPDQIWGVNFARRIVSNGEMDWLVNTPKGQTGTVSRFADLIGIEGIHPDRALEIVPYGVARSDLANRITGGDPFTRPVSYGMDAGLDVRYGITSNLRLTGAINPDFGQVEVDPAVLNLSQFETFFPEKRPFFTEGNSVFRNFGDGPANSRFNFNFYPPSFFYSRRIGRPPQGISNLAADYIDAPSQTTILGAAKLTGKIGNGWSVGVLDALTSRERARYQLGSDRLSQQVEPTTNYFVGRTTKEYGKSRIGLLFTGVDRSLPGELSYLRSGAHAVGVDGYTKFHKDDWLWEWLAGATKVTGSKEAIGATQTGPAHEYDRPDATYLHFDPQRTSLSGFGWRTMVGKQTGHWRPIVAVSGYTPGFETNDAGFMPRADEITSHAVLMYTNDSTTAHFRERQFWIGKYQNWNFGHDLVANGVYGNWFVEAKNYWRYFGWGGANGRALDDRKTRGGPLAERPTSWSAGAGLGNDSRKKFSFEVLAGIYRAGDGSWERDAGITAVFRPTTNLSLRVSPSFTREYGYAQYVTTITDPNAAATYGNHYVFSGIDQSVFDLGTRVDWTVNARLSLQVYLQPFVATGDYHGFRELARPRSGDYRPFAYDGNPDFNFRSLRGNAVLRWEFRPGSALYVVWNENRSDTVPVGRFHLRRDVGALRHAPSNDVFLIKMSYWIPM